MKNKCESCGDPIVEKPAYINNKSTKNKTLKVCQKCFRRLKRGRRAGKPTKEEYLEYPRT